MTIKDDPYVVLDDDNGGLYEALTEINVLEAPSAERCQWNGDVSCIAPATRNVVQYNPYSLEDLVDGVDLLMCEPHARAMVARLGELRDA